jgi:hypothetical protein
MLRSKPPARGVKQQRLTNREQHEPGLRAISFACCCIPVPQPSFRFDSYKG